MEVAFSKLPTLCGVALVLIMTTIHYPRKKTRSRSFLVKVFFLGFLGRGGGTERRWKNEWRNRIPCGIYIQKWHQEQGGSSYLLIKYIPKINISSMERDIAFLRGIRDFSNNNFVMLL
jgi:hypothetical protein